VLVEAAFAACARAACVIANVEQTLIASDIRVRNRIVILGCVGRTTITGGCSITQRESMNSRLRATSGRPTR
jgi:hypothetical protein